MHIYTHFDRFRYRYIFLYIYIRYVNLLFFFFTPIYEWCNRAYSFGGVHTTHGVNVSKLQRKVRIYMYIYIYICIYT